MRKKLSTIFVVLFLALPLSVQAAVEIGQPAPPLVVPMLDGKTFDLAALKSKVTLVHFWATWCAPCQEEMPVLNSFYKDYHVQGVELIALSVDNNRQRDDVRNMMKAFSFPAAILRDADTNGFGGPSAIPVTYVVDAQGIVRMRLMPETTTLTRKELEDAVKPLMNH